MKKEKKDVLWACQRTLLRCAAAARRRQPACALSTASIVQEAYLRLQGKAILDNISETHFRALAAHYMHYVVLEAAKKRRRQRAAFYTELKDEMGAVQYSMEGVLSLAEALDRLKARDERQYNVAVATWFGDSTAEQVAEQLELSVAVVKHELSFLNGWRKGLLID